MSQVVVVGGGFAGVWAAAGVVRAERLLQAEDTTLSEAIEVTLVDAGDDMVIRPRMYEAEPERWRVPLDRVLGPIGVRRLAATVTGIDTEARQVRGVGRDGASISLDYDKLILASGSRVVQPELVGAQHLFDVDTMPGAAALESHIGRLAGLPGRHERFTAVVVGAGFTGLEVATELVKRLRAVAGDEPVRVVLVERADSVGPELGPGPRPEIMEALHHLDVDVRLGVEVESLDRTTAFLSDGTTVATRTVVWTAGMRASVLTEQIPGERDRIGRLDVDEHLRVRGVADVYAAGDTAAATAEVGHTVMQSCQHAVPQGKLVGANVAADLLGQPLVNFEPDPYVTCLDLGSYGAVLTTGWDRQVAQTGAEAKQLKGSINTEWIYPPVDDAELILSHADYHTTWPTAEM